jgi:uncharacterized integral membrane protein
MLWLKRMVVWSVALLVLLGGYWIAAENTTPVTLTLFGLALPALTLGLVCCLALLLGVLLGCMVSLLPLLRLSARLRSQRRALAQRDTELTQLRASPSAEAAGK